MRTPFHSALLAVVLSVRMAAAEPPAETFETLRARAQTMGDSAEGKLYEQRFSEGFSERVQAALKECTKNTKAPYSVNVVFVIAADGTTSRIVPAPDQPVSACIAKELSGLKVPAPPKADWLVAVNIAIKE